VRTILIGGDPWFVVADVCAYFGVANRNRIMQNVDAEDKGVRKWTPLVECRP